MTTLICTHSDAMDGPALRVSMAHMPFRKEIQSPTTAGPESEPAFRVLRKFRRMFNTVRGHFQQVEKKVGVGGAQVWALGVIYKQPGIGINALAAAMDVHQTTASNLVKSLIKTNMVQAQKNGKDKRTVQLFVLPDGQRVLLSAPGPFSGVLPHALSQLDEATLDRLDTDLSTLLKLLDSDKAAEKIPLAQM